MIIRSYRSAPPDATASIIFLHGLTWPEVAIAGHWPCYVTTGAAPLLLSLLCIACPVHAEAYYVLHLLLLFTLHLVFLCTPITCAGMLLFMYMLAC
jgi:hypothetical protein